MRLSFAAAFAAALLLAAAAPGPAAAEPLRRSPGASLLIPYFEVDLDESDGRTTLLAVGNMGNEVLAHFTIYTDWGVPVYSWDLYLPPDSLATFNLRDILAYGQVAASHPAGAFFPSCTSPLSNPPLDAARLATLQKQLTGQDLGGGRCAGEPREDTTLASGSITVDAVESCSGSSLRFPHEPGYFNGGQPLASRREVLWGDFTLIDPAADFAEGFEALPLRLATGAQAGVFGDWQGLSGQVARQALDPGCSRMRFLLGGPFAAKTAFFAYTPPPQDPSDGLCASTGGPYLWRLQTFDDAGTQLATHEFATRRTSARLSAADLELPVASGRAELQTFRENVIVPDFFATTNLLLGAIEASGRFAIGLGGAPAAACTP